MAEERMTFSMGWLHDYPDFRDYTATEKNIVPLLKKMKVIGPGKGGLPQKMDLRSWCTPVEDQGSIGSCTANAGVAVVEYFERRAYGKHIDASRLFLYKVTRNLLHWTGDTGAFLRSTMAALVLFGVPPEEYWPYSIGDFEKEPPAFCYAFAQSYQAIQYYRLDPPGTEPDTLLAHIKTNLAGGLPCMFGFTVYSSVGQAANTGRIPYPTRGEKILGGHAVVAVGYDDRIKVKNTNKDKDRAAEETTGALLIRNSWGTGWGEAGYGWLPYAYVQGGLAVDWWCLVKGEWVDTREFGLQ